ncbi:MAG: cell division topological specificity factor MinE [Fusobacterium sp.]|nr:cell division topological specificity factor MinE [Fusobacterium sp.]
MGFFDFFKKENSKNDAKNRLKFVLIQDRAMLPSGVLESMKDDILKVLSKYVEIDSSKLNIDVSPYDDDPRKVALVANIPILNNKETKSKISSEKEKTRTSTTRTKKTTK